MCAERSQTCWKLAVFVRSVFFTPVYFSLTGTTLNYFLDDKINKAEILFPGVGCFLIAVCLGSAVHSSNAADNKAKLKGLTSDNKNVTEYAFILSCRKAKCFCAPYEVTISFLDQSWVN